MADTTYESTDVAGAAESLLAAMDSDEEQTSDASEEAEVEETEAEPTEDAEDDEAEEVEESDDEEESDEEDDEESEATREADTDEDNPLAEKERSLQADYTRKTMALAEERKKVDAEVLAYRQTREKLAETLEGLEQILTSSTPAEPDWDALRKEDPAEFAAQWAERERRRVDLEAVKAERSRIAEEARAEQAEAFRAHLEAEKSRLLEALPEWKDEAKAATEKRALMEYAKGLGFTDEDLSNVFDHRLILLLQKAQRFDGLKTKRETVEQKKAQAPKVLKPGSRDTAPKSGKNVKAKIAFDRLRKSGRTADAAAYIMESMPDDF